MTGKFVQKGKTTSPSLMEIPVFNYKQGKWVHFKDDNQHHLGVVLNVNYTKNLVNVTCLKRQSNSWWKLEPEIDVIWYMESDILAHAEHKSVMDQRGALYKLLRQLLELDGTGNKNASNVVKYLVTLYIFRVFK